MAKRILYMERRWRATNHARRSGSSAERAEPRLPLGSWSTAAANGSSASRVEPGLPPGGWSAVRGERLLSRQGRARTSTGKLERCPRCHPYLTTEDGQAEGDVEKECLANLDIPLVTVTRSCSATSAGIFGPKRSQQSLVAANYKSALDRGLIWRTSSSETIPGSHTELWNAIYVANPAQNFLERKTYGIEEGRGREQCDG